MRIYPVIFLQIFALALNAEIHYFNSNKAPVADGAIKAVEARASHSDARAGSASISGWRISWPGAEISLTFDFRNYVDGISTPEVILECSSQKCNVSKGINLSGGFNSIAIEWNADSSVSILVGERKLWPAMRLASLPYPTDTIRIHPSGQQNLTVEEIIIETDNNAFSRLRTRHSAEELRAAPKMRYLDRDNDPAMALPGGRYLLALINDEIIYLNGAVTNGAYWQPGMRKGRLTPTGFSGYSKLEWIDATGRRLPGENYAERDDASGTMRFVFPALGASMRFSLERQD